MVKINLMLIFAFQTQMKPGFGFVVVVFFFFLPDLQLLKDSLALNRIEIRLKPVLG